MSKQRGLGRGLGALIPQYNEEDNQNSIEVSIHQILPNPYQPRRTFDQEQLEDLADSIKTHGVLQPLLVRKIQGKYQLIAGERRWRASKLAGLTTVPVIIKDFSDQAVMEIALVENLQREDLNPLEEAEAFKRLTTEFGLTQEQIAQAVGKSRSAIANTLRLLNLSPEVREKLLSNEISMGHARALLAIEEREAQVKACQHMLKEGLNVRETEKYINELLPNNVSRETLAPKSMKASPKNTANLIDPNLKELIERLTRSFGTKITLRGKADNGRIEIEYYSKEEFERIIEMLLDR